MAVYRMVAFSTLIGTGPIPNIWNGTMFGDLDWPLNASRGLSAIAEFLVCLTNQCNALTGKWKPFKACISHSRPMTEPGHPLLLCATVIVTLISFSSVYIYAEQKRQQLTIYRVRAQYSTDVACPSSGWMTDTTWCSRQLPPHHVNIMHPLA